MLDAFDYTSMSLPALSSCYTMSYFHQRDMPPIEEVDAAVSHLPRNRISALYARLSDKVSECDHIFGPNREARAMLDHFEVAVMN